MKFSALGAVKFVVSGAVGIGTGKIAGRIIKAHVTADTLIDKVTIAAATWTIGSMAADATKKYTDGMIDDAVKQYKDIRRAIELAPKLGRINRGESTFEKEGLNESDFVKNAEGKWELKSEDFVELTVVQ